MKSSSRSTNRPVRPASVAILGATLPDPHFMARLNAALSAQCHSRKIVVASAGTPAAKQRTHDLTLVMGLEGNDENLRAADSAIRSELTNRGAGYQVLYGTTDERLSQAIRLIEDSLLLESIAPLTSIQQQNRSNRNPTWVWACDKCSDPECEHRLLTDLIAKRPAQAIER